MVNHPFEEHYGAPLNMLYKRTHRRNIALVVPGTLFGRYLHLRASHIENFDELASLMAEHRPDLLELKNGKPQLRTSQPEAGFQGQITTSVLTLIGVGLAVCCGIMLVACVFIVLADGSWMLLGPFGLFAAAAGVFAASLWDARR